MIHPQAVCLVQRVENYSSSQLVSPGTHTHTTGPKNHAAKHRLRTQKITSNISQARSTLPEDGS